MTIGDAKYTSDPETSYKASGQILIRRSTMWRAQSLKILACPQIPMLPQFSDIAEKYKKLF